MSVGRAAGCEDFFAHKKGRGGTPTSRPHVWKPHALLPRLGDSARGRCLGAARASCHCQLQCHHLSSFMSLEASSIL